MDASRFKVRVQHVSQRCFENPLGCFLNTSRFSYILRTSIYLSWRTRPPSCVLSAIGATPNLCRIASFRMFIRITPAVQRYIFVSITLSQEFVFLCQAGSHYLASPSEPTMVPYTFDSRCSAISLSQSTLVNEHHLDWASLTLQHFNDQNALRQYCWSKYLKIKVRKSSSPLTLHSGLRFFYVFC